MADGMVSTLRKAQMRQGISTVGDRIRIAREEKEMSQHEVANMLGLSRAAIAQWETNTTSPSIFKALEVSKILGVAAEWIAFGTYGAVLTPAQDPSAVKLREVSFGENGAQTFSSAPWVVSKEWLLSDLRLRQTDGLALWRVEGGNMAPGYEDGDRVLLDLKVTKPSPGGVFVHWDGVSAVINSILVRPAEGKPKALITSSDRRIGGYEVDVDDLRVLAKVKGVFKGVY